MTTKKTTAKQTTSKLKTINDGKISLKNGRPAIVFKITDKAANEAEALQAYKAATVKADELTKMKEELLPLIEKGKVIFNEVFEAKKGFWDKFYSLFSTDERVTLDKFHWQYDSDTNEFYAWTNETPNDNEIKSSKLNKLNKITIDGNQSSLKELEKELRAKLSETIPPHLMNKLDEIAGDMADEIWNDIKD